VHGGEDKSDVTRTLELSLVAGFAVTGVLTSLKLDFVCGGHHPVK